jgi:light-regulated signal transduction histidine kinase (bacteriophytochrome)
LFVPLISDEKISGIMGFESVKGEKVWTQEEITSLKLAGDILANALRRKETESLLYRAKKELELKVQELDRTNVELQRSNKELENFAYIASHDLREPLRKIKSFIELFVEDYQDKLDTQGELYLSSIKNGAIRMQNLIQELLNYSHLGKEELNLESRDLKEILQQAFEDLSIVIEENQTVIKVGKLPKLLVNGQQICRLFTNLIDNAIKFRSKIAPEIQITAQKEGNEWLISVRDNGIGFDPKHRERIFELFQRLHSKDKYLGTGMGLAVCRKIAELHGGKIWVESELGKGSTFYLTLPSS